ncbi:MULTISPECIES: sugar phosphate nucleotidyltransferase [unclassified Melioribacter]|uniref:sugar phosphate nucleotidyltransferase n=1 Tax=unclassified Melioribacter TaxID=2627329 RepID=UPI003BCAE91A
MDLAIIAAGEGLRLKEEGITIPKPLVKINGVPLIKRIIDMTLINGFDSIVCIIREESKELERFLKENYTNYPLNLIVKSTQSSFHSLYQLSRLLSTPFLLTTSDSVFLESEFKSFVNYGMNLKDADGVIAVTDFIDDEKPLYADIDENDRIINFNDSNNGYEFVTGGLYLFKKNIQKEIEEAMNSGVIRLRNFLRFLIQKDFRLYALPFSKIVDVDHVSDIKTAEEFLSDHNAKTQEKN